MTHQHRVELDYDRTLEHIGSLTETRFKLLALVPTAAGAAVALLATPRPAAELLGAGMIGLTATVGIFVYESRNSQLLGALHQRARHLERHLGFVPGADVGAAGGIYSERPSPGGQGRVLGIASHRLGLALVYAAAISGWTYLVAWGALAGLHSPEPRGLGAAIAVVVGLVLVASAGRTTRSR